MGVTHLGEELYFYISAEVAGLHRHLPLERFEPAAAGVLNSGDTYLHFSGDRLRVGTYRAFGFDFERR
jgi:hypothetical protein